MSSLPVTDDAIYAAYLDAYANVVAGGRASCVYSTLEEKLAQAMGAHSGAMNLSLGARRDVCPRLRSLLA